MLENCRKVLIRGEVRNLKVTKTACMLIGMKHLGINPACPLYLSELTSLYDRFVPIKIWTSTEILCAGPYIVQKILMQFI